MRSIDWLKAFVCVGVLAAAETAATPSQAASGCSSLSASTTTHSTTLGPFTVTLNAGDVVSMSDATTLGGTDQLTVGSSSSSFAMPGSTSITVTATGTYAVTATIGFSPIVGLVTLSCTSGTASIEQQSANNAQVAITNGLRTLQNYQEWVTKGVLGSFGMTRGGDTAFGKPDDGEQRARAKVASLVRKERELTEELAELPTDNARAGDLDVRLAIARRELKFARLSPDLSVADGSTRRVLSPEQDSCGAEACSSTGASDDPLARKWNAWAEGRVVGATDGAAQTNTLGFAGASGVDYKFRPWLAVGLSAGVENYETRFGVPGVRSGSTGLTLLPYFGMRLHENIYAEGFVGLTKLYYNINPAATVTGTFDATRLFFGGAISGVWHDGAWRFQPSILGAYGTETQNAYNDTTGSAIPSQTVTFGRIAAGPEIGYTFKDEGRGWTFEPFALLKANLDFSSAPVYTFNGLTATVVRSGAQGSGQVGGGVAMQLDEGFYIRLQASYDSIGVTGLDVWSGRIRAGRTF
jgi:hypothetical protein